VRKDNSLKIDTIKNQGDKSMLLLEQQASAKARAFPILISADSKMLGMLIPLPQGMRADPNAMRTFMCKMLAVAQAPSDRTITPPEHPPANILAPSVPFDMAAAKVALESGDASIGGKACVASPGAPAAYTNVVLFPDTPYLEEWVNLLHKFNPSKDQLVTDPQFLATSLKTRTNSNGEFQFSKLKPGKYYLLSTYGGNEAHSKDVLVGSEQAGDQITQYYKTENWLTSFQYMLESFETVSAGEDKKITLTVPITGKRLLDMLFTVRTGHRMSCDF
jgi:hypothetical protein